MCLGSRSPAGDILEALTKSIWHLGRGSVTSYERVLCSIDGSIFDFPRIMAICNSKTQRRAFYEDL